jgi:hypothetical protein
MNKNLKRFLLILILVAFIGGVVAYRMWNKPHADASDEKGIPLTAQVLYTAFETNEQKANASYVGKVVEVTGEISEISVDSLTKVTLTFPTAVMGGVIVSIDQRHKSDVSSLKKGDLATFKGFCSGYLMDVIINDGVLVKKTAN